MVIIKQEKQDKELIDAAHKVIDSLKGFNEVEQYKIIKGLYLSLKDGLIDAGLLIVEEEKDE